ncbi:hypothetical protein [Tsukamurella pseudospumae]|uniref:hypothetical protein n=1 Tax=Tsukamurella pseudospumae TaxID=239498 RepID=UPI0012E71779|nr:hypothetical protein [Tsukamurella pseudospumae]
MVDTGTDGTVVYRVSRDGSCGLDVASSEHGFRLAYRDRIWTAEDFEIRSKPAGDNVRRVWTLRSDAFAGSASERGTGRSALRQVGAAFSAIPFHLLHATRIDLTDDAGAVVARIRSRRVLPIGFVLESDDPRLDTRTLAAIVVVVGADSMVG